MRERPDELEDTEGDEPLDFPPPERKINTQPYDLSVRTLIEQWEENTLSIPEIQREYVWDNGRASRLIESLILNIPVPPLYFSETKDAKFEVIDGHQRIKSVVRYIDNQFVLSGLRVLGEFKGMRFHRLPDREQRFLKSRSLRAVVISHDSHSSMKFEVFERLNTGGISLNAQEVRNSIYRGTFNQELKTLVTNAHFRQCIGTIKPRRRMVDEQLALRFFALRELLPTYRPPLKRKLNDYMDTNRNPSEAWLDERREVFESTMAEISSVLQRQSFRLIDGEGNPLRDKDGKPLPRGVNRALFDAQALAFSWATKPFPPQSIPEVVGRISNALGNERTLDAVSLATGDRKRIVDRVMAMVLALREAGIDTVVPEPLDADYRDAE